MSPTKPRIGNWVIPNQNANPGKIPICVVTVSQDNPNNLHRLCPWGSTLPSGVPVRESRASFAIDPQNRMIYAQDWFVNGVFAVHLNQQTGDLTQVWSRPDWRNSDYFSLLGPANKRVLISQYLNPDTTLDQLGPAIYTESVLWVNAATGKTLAQSGYNPSTAQGSLPNLGYGGLIYVMGNNGQLYIYKVVKA